MNEAWIIKCVSSQSDGFVGNGCLMQLMLSWEESLCRYSTANVLWCTEEYPVPKSHEYRWHMTQYYTVYSAFYFLLCSILGTIGTILYSDTHNTHNTHAHRYSVSVGRQRASCDFYVPPQRSAGQRSYIYWAGCWVYFNRVLGQSRYLCNGLLSHFTHT